MKHVLTTILVATMALCMQAQDLKNSGAHIVLKDNSHLVVQGNYVNQNNGQMHLGGTVWLTGNWENNAATNALATPDASNAIRFNGSALQTIGGTYDTAHTFEAMNIETGAQVELPAGNKLTLLGDLTIDGDFTLKSVAGGTATLIDNGNITVNGNATVEQYLTNNRWWYVSPQTAAANSDDLLVDGSTYYLYSWNEDNSGASGWNGIPASTALDALTGYAYYNNSAGPVTAEYTGDLNTGPYGSADNMTHSSGATKAGYNLTGNPYPSHINWGSENSPATEPTKANLATTIWTRIDGNFATYNWTGDGTAQNGASQYIAPGQAFWVKVEGTAPATGTLAVDNDTRTHDTQELLKNNENNILRLQVSNVNKTDETVIGFYDNAKNTIESYDSEKMFTDDVAYPQLYSYLSNQELAINGLPKHNGESRTIPLGFKTQQAGEFTLSATNIGDFAEVEEVYLEDLETGTLQGLRKNEDYTFSSEVANTTARFRLVFGPQNTTGVEGITSNIKIFNSQGQVYIQTTLSGPAQVYVYDVAGKQLIARQMNLSAGLNSFTAPAEKGVYVVKMLHGNRVYTEKIIEFIK